MKIKTNPNREKEMKHPEQDLQIACVTWFYAQYGTRKDCKLFHSPNGGKRSAREAAKFKAMGVLPGVPDLILLHQGKAHFFELKSDKGKLIDSQKDFGMWLLTNGFECAVIKSFDEFKSAIESLLSAGG